MKKLYGWNIVLILLAFVTAGVFLTLAPDRIPVHYDIAGNIDRWGSKYEYLVMPVVTALMGVFMMLMTAHEEKKGRDSNARTVAVVGIVVLLQFNLMWMIFMGKIMDPDTMQERLPALGGRAILILLMASLIPVGNLMPKVRRNGALGLRTKWSMADDVCWQKSQRLGGWLMVGCGIAGVALVSLLPDRWIGAAVYIPLALMLVGSVLGSYRIWKKEQTRASVEE